MKPDNEFERLALPLRRELVAYCYRMTGSADDLFTLIPVEANGQRAVRD